MEAEMISVSSLTQRVIDAFGKYQGAERARELAIIRYDAGQIRAKGVIDDLIKTLAKEQAEFDETYSAESSQIVCCDDGTQLDCNDKGVKNITNNYMTIMFCDNVYQGFRYNVLLDAAEQYTKNGKRRCTDADTAFSRAYIEQKYKIYSIAKHDDAMRMFYSQIEYNPILDIIEELKWDGVNRIEDCLHKWMMCEDTPYTREVSRLIFAGGIWRLYSPGCKFDDVPVLVGTKQGEGKSTFISWLALNDEYFGEVKTVEGKEAIEQLKGKWICEIAELNAFTKAREVEAVKAFVTRQNDEYRKPYDKTPSSNPRRCIFVGTTNTEQFLRDKSGNRRFYPVTVHSIGYDLFDREKECREYIEQCWAEARERYKAGDFRNFARRDLKDYYEAAQNASMEDDWKVGVIGKYLDEKEPGEIVCVREIVVEALSPDPQHPMNGDPKTAREIGQIIAKNHPEWEKCGARKTLNYGSQKCWKKFLNEEPDLLP